MSRINTNVTALIASRIFNNNNQALNKSLERLSTGLRINRGSDDPAGLIASESLRADKAAIGKAISNAERASSIVSTAEGALNEISDKLIKVQELVAQAANSGGLTQEEIDANQLQVDGIIESIGRIASETSFQGTRLLNGSMDFTVVEPNADVLTDLTVNAAKFSGSSYAVTVNLVDSGALANVAGPGGVMTNAATIEISGAKGTETFSFASGALVADMVTSINGSKDTIGVSAVDSGGTLSLYSTQYGADKFVQTQVLSGGTGTNVFTAGRNAGTDAIATIDGRQAAVNGYNASLRTTNLNVDFAMSTDFVDGTTTTATFTVTGGGAKFSISPNVGMSGQACIGIQSVAAHNLGSATNGYLSAIATGETDNLTDDPEGAQAIVGDAVKQVASMRGRLGSFMDDTIGSTINSLQVALENVSAAESAIRDTDFATETANLTRNQILINAGTSVLAIANAAPQAILGLLG